MRIGLKGIAALAVVALIVGMAGAAFATVYPNDTNPADYSPGSTVTISGDNTNGAGYVPNETVQVDVSGPNGYQQSCTNPEALDGVIAVTAEGTWSCQVTLNGDDSAVGSYSYTATGTQSGVTEQGSFTDGPETDCNQGSLTDCHVKQDSLQTRQLTDCTAKGGTVTGWHFVIQPLNGEPMPASAPAKIHVTWGAPANTSADVLLSGVQGQNADYDTVLNAGSLVTDATATIPSANTGNIQFNLSSTTCQINTPESSLNTQVHDADHNNITNGSTALGSVVHDNATVTYKNGSLGNGASVTFVLLTNTNGTDCATGSPGTPEKKENLGTSPVVLDSLPAGPLAAGNYAYKVTFDSGDGSTIPDQVDHCEPFTVNKADTTTLTEVHAKGGHAPDIQGTSVALGSSVHDKAIVGSLAGGFTIGGTVTYTLYKSGTPLSSEGNCTGDKVKVVNNADAETVAVGTESTDTQALSAGYYGYQATYSGDSNYKESTGVCEPFTVNKANTTTSTKVHDADHKDITYKSVVPGSYVHDTATVGSQVGTFVISGSVTYSFYENGACSGTPTGTEVKNLNANGTVPDSSERKIDVSGSYAYQATYSGDSNYNASPLPPADCEPFSVYQPGKTMGFWGNTNGIARIIADDGYAANAVNIGRGANIDTQPESTKVLPNALNACGPKTPYIFTVGAQTGTKDCTLANGVNKGSLNTLAAQTLALGYNINVVGGYSGQTIGALPLCSTYVTAGLTASNTVDDALNAAKTLIDNSSAGGSTTQSQIGAMNQLLNCLNKEA